MPNLGDPHRRHHDYGGYAMTWPGIVALAFAVVASGCTPVTSPETTTTTVAIATVPEPTTSSTTAPEDTPVDLCAAFVAWEVDTVHVARCFLAPIAFTPDIGGWHTTSANAEAIAGHWTSPDDNQPSIRFVVLAYVPAAAPSEVLGSILTIDGVNAVRDPAESEGVQWVDVETEPVLMRMPNLELVDCARDATLDLIKSGGEPGYTLLDRTSLGQADGGSLYGLGACRLFRIWAVPISDITITVVATTDDLDRFDELMPTMQRLVDTITVATP